MEVKKSIKARSLKFNFELNKNVFGNSLFIEKNDIEKSILSINLLCEYIRFCYFDDYYFQNSHKLDKYCRLLLRFERCNQSVIVKHCRYTIKSLLNQAIKSPYSTKSIDLSLCFSDAHSESICDLCETLIIEASGTHIRGISF